MADGRDDAERRAEIGRCQFGAQFLAGIERRTKPPRLVARQPFLAARPVAEFVKRRPVIVDLLRERRLRRHLHIIAIDGVKRPRPADAEIRPRCGNQAFRALMLFARR